MQHIDIWDTQAAQSYDTPGVGMFAPDVLDPVVKRLASLANGGNALEFAIGTGRVALPLRATGVPVSGIEIATAMLAQLRTKAPENAIPVVLGDMMHQQVPGEFSLVYLVFNGISNLLTQADQVACFRNAARHLTSGGRFVVELWVPTIPHPADPQASVGASRHDYLLVDTCDVVAQHVVSHHFAMDDSRQAQLFRSPHRYVWPSELDLMGQLAGFNLESRHADWVGTPFTATARHHVSVYRLG